jgi:hypothetical protein
MNDSMLVNLYFFIEQASNSFAFPRVKTRGVSHLKKYLKKAKRKKNYGNSNISPCKK